MPKRSAQKRFARSLLRPGSSVLAWPPLRAAQGRVGGVRSRQRRVCLSGLFLVNSLTLEFSDDARRPIPSDSTRVT